MFFVKYFNHRTITKKSLETGKILDEEEEEEVYLRNIKKEIFGNFEDYKIEDRTFHRSLLMLTKRKRKIANTHTHTQKCYTKIM